MNGLIKTGCGNSKQLALEVKPIDLTPVGSRDELEFGRDIDPALLTDPVQKARFEAQAIIREARAQADSIRERARAEGLETGIAEAARRADELLQRLESDLEAAAADRDAIVDAVEPQVLKLCIEIVEKIIRHEVRTDTRVVMRVIKSCLRRIKDSSEIYVRVSPQELAEVKARREELVGLSEGVREIRIVDDSRVSPGGCVIESEAGNIDARIETQLSKIDAKLTETLHNDRDQTRTGPDEAPAGDQSD